MYDLRKIAFNNVIFVCTENLPDNCNFQKGLVSLKGSVLELIKFISNILNSPFKNAWDELTVTPVT